MSIEELIEIVEMSKFKNLLNRHKLTLTYKKHEHHDGPHDSFAIGYESSNCKLAFYCEAEISAAILAKDCDWEKTEWIDLEYIIAYIKNEALNRIETNLINSTDYKEKFVYKLSSIARDLEPLFAKIVEMCKTQDMITNWKPNLQKYVKEEMQHKYGLK